MIIESPSQRFEVRVCALCGKRCAHLFVSGLPHRSHSLGARHQRALALADADHFERTGDHTPEVRATPALTLGAMAPAWETLVPAKDAARVRRAVEHLLAPAPPAAVAQAKLFPDT